MSLTDASAVKSMRTKRNAQVELCWLQVELPGRNGHLKSDSPIRLNAVHVLEPRGPSISPLQLHR